MKISTALILLPGLVSAAPANVGATTDGTAVARREEQAGQFPGPGGLSFGGGLQGGGLPGGGFGGQQGGGQQGGGIYPGQVQQGGFGGQGQQIGQQGPGIGPNSYPQGPAPSKYLPSKWKKPTDYHQTIRRDQTTHHTLSKVKASVLPRAKSRNANSVNLEASVEGLAVARQVALEVLSLAGNSHSQISRAFLNREVVLMAGHRAPVANSALHHTLHNSPISLNKEVVSVAVRRAFLSKDLTANVSIMLLRSVKTAAQDFQAKASREVASRVSRAAVFKANNKEVSAEALVPAPVSVVEVVNSAAVVHSATSN